VALWSHPVEMSLPAAEAEVLPANGNSDRFQT